MTGPRPEPLPGGGPYRWVVLAVATVVQAGACLFTQSLGALAPFVADDLGLRAGQVGLLVAAALLVPVPGLLLAGALLDRFDERWVVGSGTALLAGCLALGSLSTTFGGLLLVLLLVGAAYSTVQPGGSVSVASWFAGPQRGLALGVRQAGLPLGGALGAWLLPVVAARHGWQASLLCAGGVALGCCVLFLAVYRRPPGRAEHRGGVRAVPAPRARLLRDPAFRIAVGAGAALSCAQYGTTIYLALYLVETTATTATGAGVLLAVALGCGTIGRVLLAAWSDRHPAGRFGVLAHSAAGVTAGVALLPVLPLLPGGAAPVLVALLGFFGFGWYGPWVALATEVAPRGSTGFAVGGAMAGNQLCIVLAAPLLGVLRDATGSYVPGWLLLAAGAAGAAVVLYRRRGGTPAR